MDGGAGSQDEFGEEMGDGTDHGGGKSVPEPETPATGPTLVEQVDFIFQNRDDCKKDSFHWISYLLIQ